MRVSIVICTRNRAQSLAETLASIARCEVPIDVSAELLVVDNGSTDQTAEVVRSLKLSNMEVRYVREDRRGLSHARNRALAESAGDIILFTDDDVRPPANWIEGMCRPIVSGAADAVAGGVRLAPHLCRPWMRIIHRGMLASTEYLDPRRPQEFVGANMSISRQLLTDVPAFDPELGAGALGFCEESLFAWQLSQAGYRLAAALETSVEHHPPESRLARSSYVEAAMKLGRCRAYIAYHWEHRVVKFATLRLVAASVRLAVYRIARSGNIRAVERCDEEELRLITSVYFFWQLMVERRHPRKYTERGLVKLRSQVHGVLCVRS